MKDNTGFSGEDEIMRLGDILVKRDDCSLYGCYRDGVQVLAKDMSEDEKLKAHAIIRKYTFDIVKEIDKDLSDKLGESK